jgi:hypothetical protein
MTYVQKIYWKDGQSTVSTSAEHEVELKWDGWRKTSAYIPPPPPDYVTQEELAEALSGEAGLLNRANHTGTQLATTISDFADAVEAALVAQLAEGANVSIDHDELGHTFTISSSGSGGGSGLDFTALAIALLEGTGIDLAVDDVNEKITVSVAGLGISDISGLTTALSGKAATTHTHDDRYYTEAEINTALADKAAGVHTHDDRYFTETEVTNSLATKSDTGHTHTTSEGATDIEQWRIDNKVPRFELYDSSLGESPGAIGNAVAWLDVAGGGVVSDPAVSLVTHQQNSTDGSSWTVTPNNLLNTFSDHDYFIAFVWSGNSTVTPANDADTLTGGGMTWTPVGTPESSGNGIITLSVFRSTAGTPDGSNLVVGVTGGSQGAIIEVVAVRDLPYQNVFLDSTATGAASATLAVPGATENQRLIATLGWNSGSVTVTTDPGGTLLGLPDLTMQGPTIQTRASVVQPAATSISWTKSLAAHQAFGAVLVGAP